MVRRLRISGFTIVELLVATAVLILLLGILFVAISETGKIWRHSSDQIESFQDARAAFETITSTLSQATLNTYYDYFDSTGHAANEAAFSGVPARYGRQSELHFISGSQLIDGQVTHAVFFQAPLGYAAKSYASLGTLLNACGFFVRFTDDSSTSSLSGRPPFLDNLMQKRFRYQLMMLSQPSENLSIFSSTGTGSGWYANFLNATPPNARVLAENIVVFVVLPKETDADEAGIPAGQRIGANYSYDSRTAWSGTKQPTAMNQLCPIVKVLMIAADESSIARVQGTSSAPPSLGIDYSVLFKEAAKLPDDLAKAEAALANRKINYRVFQAEIPLRNSKWSTQ